MTINANTNSNTNSNTNKNLIIGKLERHGVCACPPSATISSASGGVLAELVAADDSYRLVIWASRDQKANTVAFYHAIFGSKAKAFAAAKKFAREALS